MGTKPMKEAKWSAFPNRAISSISTIRVAAVVTPIPGTDVNSRIGFSKGSFRDISRMARVFCNSIFRKRMNCSR